MLGTLGGNADFCVYNIAHEIGQPLPSKAFLMIVSRIFNGQLWITTHTLLQHLIVLQKVVQGWSIFLFYCLSFLLCRYEVCICNGIKVETVASGFLEQLLLHSPEVKNLYSKRPNATFKIQLPGSLNGAEWFTKSILTRFISSRVSLFVLVLSGCCEFNYV